MDQNLHKFHPSQLWGFVSRSIPLKKHFFWNGTKKMKFGQGWPESSRMDMNRFGTIKSKHLTPYKHISFRLSILEKYSRSKEGVLFPDSTVPYPIFLMLTSKKCLYDVDSVQNGVKNLLFTSVQSTLRTDTKQFEQSRNFIFVLFEEGSPVKKWREMNPETHPQHPNAVRATLVKWIQVAVKNILRIILTFFRQKKYH